MLDEDGLKISIKCPLCGFKNDRVTGLGGGEMRPHDNDLSICFQCRGIAVFVSGPFGITLRPPTSREKESLVTAGLYDKVNLAFAGMDEESDV